MKILVTGGTGMVGSQVVRELLEQDEEVTVLSRKSKEEAQLPEEAHYLHGNLMEPATVRTMCKGMDAMFLINTVSPTEAHEGLMAVNGARLANIKKIVYLSVHKVDQAPHLPHFGAKIAVEAAIKNSGIPYVILRANNFYQNDYWFKDSILKMDIYPQPFGDSGLSRVVIRDIAGAAAITLTNKKYRNITMNLVGPDILTAKETAEIWSEALDKEIFYSGDNLDAWEKQFLQYMPEFMVFDFKLMYEFFQESGLRANRDDLKQLTDLLGHRPRKFRDFTREAAASWKKEMTLNK